MPLCQTKTSTIGIFIVLAICLQLFIKCGAQHYTNQWAVHIEGGEDVAKRLASQHGFTYVDQIMPDYYHFKHQKVSKRSLFASSHSHSGLALEPEVKWVEQQVSKKRVKRDGAQSVFNDPMWPRLWYLHRDGGLDMNVIDVYQKWKITGKGAVVSILDDGIEKDHPDLMKNYDAGASYDVNGHDPDPEPRYDYSNENRHGTRCAGEVASEANNNVCGTGIAYEASIGGVRMLDGDVTDAVEAQSISLNPQHIHIYSASWGPDDDGRTVDGPGPLARMAFFDGINKGRHGLGSIYVWASGNGGRNGDSCSCDGYTNSIYTLSISSASENGLVPWYSEACASTLATTYSSGSPTERQILTTDLRHLCTENHTGTSASAPLAAGICALALQANPDLTWRDMQYLVVLTARQANLQADDWVVNGIGRKVSHHYGFGLMNAAAMVELAFNWTRLPDQHRCQVTSRESPRNLLANSMADFTLETDGCEDSTDVVRSLEHVQVSVTLSASRRGEVELELTSPSGTRSVLLARRVADTSGEGLNNWVMMTTHCWGERPSGTWTLSIHSGATPAQLASWSLILYGTAESPRVLVDYLSSSSVHPSLTQTRQVDSTEHETTISQPPVESTASTSSIGANSTIAVVFFAMNNKNIANVSSSPSTTITANVSIGFDILRCDPGLVQFEDRCIRNCPRGYYPSIQSFSRENSSGSNQPIRDNYVICTGCDSSSDCPLTFKHKLLEWLLIATLSVVCLAMIAAVIVCLLKHVVCTKNDYEALSYRRPHSHVDVIGLHDKHLLSSDSDSSDELDLIPMIRDEYNLKQET